MNPDQTATATIPLLIGDLYEAAGALRHHGDRLAAPGGQTQARWQVMSVISDGKWTVPRIARRLGISRQAIQRVVDLLRAEGLAAIDANPDHQRSPFVHLTPAGVNTLTAITAAARDWHEELASVLDPADLAATRRVLQTLARAARPNH